MPVSAHATSDADAQTVIVSASRIPSTLANIVGSTTVISRADIDSFGPADAVDLLRRVPGIHIDRPGGLGGVSSIYLRGSDPNYTRVLIDGVPLNDPTNSRGGSFDVSTIDLSMIERIEIARGPQSAIHGSDAIAGVINFVTRSGTETTQYSVVASAGKYGQRSNGFQVRGPMSKVGDFAIGAAVVDGGNPIEGSEFRNRTASLKTELFITNDASLRIAARASENNSSNFPDDSGGPVFAERRTSDQRDATELSVGARFEQEARRHWIYVLESAVYRRRENFASPGVAPGLRNAFGIPINSSETTFERVEVRWINQIPVSDTFTGIIGSDIVQESGTNNSRLITGAVPSDSRFALNRRTVGWFTEGRWEARPNWNFGVSMRLDNPEGFSNTTSFSAGTVYMLKVTGTRLKAVWGEGFKLPSFFALGNSIVGDPGLRPETSKAIEGSVLQSLLGGAVEFDLTVFRNWFYESIDFDDELNKLVNRPLIVGWGTEITGSWLVTETLSLGAHVAYVDTDIRGVEEELRNRPKWQIALDTRWRWLEIANITGSVGYVDQALDSSLPTGPRTLDDYIRVDVAADWQIVPGWRVSAAIDNLFDAEYEEAVGFRAPGITPRVSLQINF